jgi:hypothetical protein
MLISIDDITTFITLFYYNINKNNINANTMWITQADDITTFMMFILL